MITIARSSSRVNKLVNTEMDEAACGTGANTGGAEAQVKFHSKR
jgi:hypothetical protein